MYIVYGPNHEVRLITEDPDKVLTNIKVLLPEGENIGISTKYPNTLFTSHGVYTVKLVEVDQWIV